jgi:hypothetical protein
VTGKLEQISCGYHGQVWGTTSSNHVYYREGINSVNVEGTEWTRAPTDMLYVSVGLTGAIWGVNAENGVPMMRTGVTRETPYGKAWMTSPGQNMRQLEAGDCQVYGTNDMHEIYRLKKCTIAEPIGEGWEEVGGTLRHIAVG